MVKLETLLDDSSEVFVSVVVVDALLKTSANTCPVRRVEFSIIRLLSQIQKVAINVAINTVTWTQYLPLTSRRLFMRTRYKLFLHKLQIYILTITVLRL